MDKKDKEIEELKARLEVYEGSPYSNAYIGLYETIDRWSGELKTTNFSIQNTGDDDMKAFEKAHKVATSMKVLFDQLDFLRSKMTPQQQDDVKKVASSIFEKALQSQGELDENS